MNICRRYFRNSWCLTPKISNASKASFCVFWNESSLYNGRCPLIIKTEASTPKHENFFIVPPTPKVSSSGCEVNYIFSFNHNLISSNFGKGFKITKFLLYFKFKYNIISKIPCKNNNTNLIHFI